MTLGGPGLAAGASRGRPAWRGPPACRPGRWRRHGATLPQRMQGAGGGLRFILSRNFRHSPDERLVALEPSRRHFRYRLPQTGHPYARTGARAVGAGIGRTHSENAPDRPLADRGPRQRPARREPGVPRGLHAERQRFRVRADIPDRDRQEQRTDVWSNPANSAKNIFLHALPVPRWPPTQRLISKALAEGASVRTIGRGEAR